jgi:transaldolase
MTNPLVELGRLGQSPWLDYITRELLASGRLARLIREDGLLGMTSNPTIFEKAITGSEDYDETVGHLFADGKDPAQIFESIAVADVQSACDIFRDRYDALDGTDGLVSIEVSPDVANDSSKTREQAERLWRAVDRPNVMVKIPGTEAGLTAITESLAAGININVTLLFSVERYRQVIDAFMTGLELRASSGKPIDRLVSVASFFVSRVDGKVDPLLDQQGEGDLLRGTIAIANAAIAYRTFEESLESNRWKNLAAKGARPQRPLWASTSTKDPRYSDIHYVEPLIAPHTVNTLPPETIDAYRDHGHPAVRIQQTMAEAPGRLDELKRRGIDLDRITRELEIEGVEKFAASYRGVVGSIEKKAEEIGARS